MLTQHGGTTKAMGKWPGQILPMFLHCQPGSTGIPVTCQLWLLLIQCSPTAYSNSSLIAEGLDDSRSFPKQLKGTKSAARHCQWHAGKQLQQPEQAEVKWQSMKALVSG